MINRDDQQDDEQDPTKPKVPTQRQDVTNQTMTGDQAEPPAYPDPNVTTGPITTQPVAAPVTADPAAATAAVPSTAQQMQTPVNYDRTWTDFIQSKYGQAARGAGFANMPAGGVAQAVQDFNAATGGQATVVGGPSGDMIDFHDGRGPVDVKTAAGDLWNQRLGGNNGEPGGGGPSAGAAGTAGGGAMSGFPDFSKLFASQTSGGVNDPRAGALFDMLMAKAKQSESIDPNDPTIRKQADTFSAAQTRAGRQYLQQLAESKGAGANIGAEARMTAEKGAQASAQNEGAIMQHEMDSRRQEIMQALSQAGQFMTAQQQMSLQAELASLNAQTQKYGMDLSNGQYYAGLGSQNRQFDNNLAQRAYEYDTTDNYNRTRVN